MAVVYKAQDLMLRRPVAIKLLRQDYSRHPEFSQRFQLEARAAAALSHSNIVTVHDFGHDSGRYFIVMEYVEGRNLKDMIREVFQPVASNRRMLNKEELAQKRELIARACYLVSQACAGVGYAHRMHLVHCDVKPHNMLVTRDNRLKVTDFGIARALSTIDENEQNEEVWGSPQYFSPEQASGHAPSPASDVYSLGIILYEMLTGQLPFNATDPQELARMHRESPIIPPRRLNNQIPEELEKILTKVLSKDPHQRYRTADQFGRLLMKFAGGSEMYPPMSMPETPMAQDAGQTQTQPSSPPPPSNPPLGTPASPPSSSPRTAPEPQAEPGWLDAMGALLTPDILILGFLALALLASTIPFIVYVLSRIGIV
jgi:eukaryotic-like serine/threonine-protein kinase